MQDNANIHLNYYCDKCNYVCSKKSCWTQHLLTRKHNEINIANKIYACNKCNMEFKHQSSCCRHKKKCYNKKDILEETTINHLSSITPELILELIKNNKELQQIVLEQHTTLNNLVKNGVSTNYLNNSNNNNKTFNLQFFLNETCKDAMNIMDFVDSIKLQLSDLEKVGEIGYTQGISNIITTNLKALEVTQRPVHCTDKKRETMYIKDEDKWEKDDDNNTKLRKAIKRVANKNITLLPRFREKYPDYSNSSSRISDKYDHIVVEAMGGVGNNDLEKEDKIIHNISKCVTICK